MIKAPELHDTRVTDGRAKCTCGWHSPRGFGDPSPFVTWHQLAIGETIDNPYLRAFLSPTSEVEFAAIGSHGSEYLAQLVRRDRLVAEYAWAIPTEDVVRKLAKLSPICDLGCGTGYWAKLLRDVGAEVLAVDANPPLEGNNHWHRQLVTTHWHKGTLQSQATVRHFTDVVKGDAATFNVPSEQTLMLCWPPYHEGMAQQALDRYEGTRVIYIGEREGGCTGNDGFHATLAEQWRLDARYEIPQWWGLHDEVCVYARL